MSSAEERAAERRQSWSGGVAASFEELDVIDAAAWSDISPEERLGLVWSLVLDSMALGGQSGPAPRLQRLVGGVRPLKAAGRPQDLADVAALERVRLK